MENFKVGDKVKHKIYGLGVIDEIDTYYEDIYHGSFDDGRSAWSSGIYLTKIEPQKQTIVIKREDDTVTAYMGKYKAVAKCSLDDEFDLYKGAVLAITRLLVEGKIDG